MRKVYTKTVIFKGCGKVCVLNYYYLIGIKDLLYIKKRSKGKKIKATLRG